MALFTYKTKLYASLIISIGAVIVAVSGYFGYVYYNKSMKLADQADAALVHTFTLGARDLILAHDYSSLDEFIRSLSRNKRIIYIIVGSQDNEIIGRYLSNAQFSDEMKRYALHPIESTTPVIAHRQIATTSVNDLFFPIIIAHKRWGWVRIGCDRHYLNQDLLDILKSGLAFLAGGLLLAYFVALALHRSTAASFAHLKMKIKEMSEGKFDEDGLGQDGKRDEFQDLLLRMHSNALEFQEGRSRLDAENQSLKTQLDLKRREAEEAQQKLQMLLDEE